MKPILSLALISALGLASAAIAGPPLRLTFDNQSSRTVQVLDVRISGSKAWGPNRLAKPLAPHSKVQVLIEDGSDKCVLDFAVTADGMQRNFWRSMCNDRTFKFYGSP